MGAWDRRAPGEIFFDKWLNHGFLEPLLVVHHVMRHAQMLRDTLRIVYIIERAAALSARAVAIKRRKAALVPQLHGQANHRNSALHKHRRDC